MPEYGYTRDFRVKLLALMLDDEWMAKFGGAIMQPEYFDRSDEESIAKAIIDYRRKYGNSPTDDADLLAMVGENDLVPIVFDYVDTDLRLAADLSLKFAKEQATRLAILESVDDIQKGDLQKPIERMKEALAVGDSLLSPGIDPIADVDKWLYDYWSDKVPTGWSHIDNYLEGGLAPGELGCIMGPSNRGKSMALINLGYGAASILAGKNVVHLTHEMRASQVCKRYAARMVFRFPTRHDNLEEYAEELVEKARKLLPGKIRVIDGKMSVNDLEARIDRLVEEGFEPGIIIDDYADLLVPERHYSDKRFELSDIFQFLRDTTKDKFGLPLWTASQSTRASYTKEIVTSSDIAEDIGKVNISDVIITVNQTHEELQANQCRLYMAKVRDGPKGACFQAKFVGTSQAIITTGLVERKDEKDV